MTAAARCTPVSVDSFRPRRLRRLAAKGTRTPSAQSARRRAGKPGHLALPAAVGERAEIDGYFWRIAEPTDLVVLVPKIPHSFKTPEG